MRKVPIDILRPAKAPFPGSVRFLTAVAVMLLIYGLLAFVFEAFALTR